MTHYSGPGFSRPLGWNNGFSWKPDKIKYWRIRGADGDRIWIFARGDLGAKNETRCSSHRQNNHLICAVNEKLVQLLCFEQKK